MTLSNRLVIVDLDEKSLNRYGQWPWPRYRLAELFDKITAMKPRCHKPRRGVCRA